MKVVRKMLVDYPREWNKYFVDGKIMTFSADTPNEIVEKAKKVNDTMMRTAGKEYFHFENSEPAQK